MKDRWSEYNPGRFEAYRPHGFNALAGGGKNMVDISTFTDEDV